MANTEVLNITLLIFSLALASGPKQSSSCNVRPSVHVCVSPVPKRWWIEIKTICQQPSLSNSTLNCIRSKYLLECCPGVLKPIQCDAKGEKVKFPQTF